MIITRTPLRVSFVGGGSDLPSFWQEEPGYVVSTAIDKFIYITVNPKYDGAIRVSYSVTENVQHVRDLQHDRVKASLLRANIKRGVEITSVADVPAGTGLGSSSSFTVGLLHALQAYQHEFCTVEALAHAAYRIETQDCNAPIGKQDQYAAAYGGLKGYTFYSDGRVGVEALPVQPEILTAFERRLLLFPVGVPRVADVILAEQAIAMKDSRARADIRALANLAHTFRDALLTGRLDECGDILDAAWRLKRNVVRGITDSAIDAAYAAALQHGARGGKLLGAGGSGFLLLYTPEERHRDIQRALGVHPFPFQFSPQGSTIIYAD